MNIHLKMQIQNEAIELTANLTLKACRIYRQNFSRDLLQDMQNIYKTYNKSPFEGINFAGMDVEGKSEQEIYAQLLSRVDVTKLSELHTLSGEQTETGYQIVWAFLKNADPDLPGYEKWTEQFDYILPIGEIITALFDAWNANAKPTVEIKN